MQFGPGGTVSWQNVAQVPLSEILDTARHVSKGSWDAAPGSHSQRKPRELALEDLLDRGLQVAGETASAPMHMDAAEPAAAGGGAPLTRRRRRTKIVCAIGPASRSVEKLMELMEAGMNIARLNFSHGDHAYHLQTLLNIREAERRRRAMGIQCHCAVLMDTKGPEIRTGFLKDHEPVQLRVHQLLEITTDYSIAGDDKRISCSYEHLATSARVGGTVLIADGSISCRVVKIIDDKSILVRVENNALLEERKNMNIPGAHIRIAGITEKDVFDLEHFALKYDVDIVSGSFIRTAENVRSLRAHLGDKGRRIRVHAKIESVEGLQNFHEILAEADGVHVSRGDLGMELPLSKLFLAQKAIIRWANLAGKPVVTSTQMLDSMTERPRPTNAECNDVANAVLDGTDCMMLSSETAKGLYPVESVQTMARIIAEAELVLDYDGHFSAIREEVLSGGKTVSVMEALASSAVESSLDVDAPLIVLLSETGALAKLVAKYRPPARVLVVTSNEMTARQMSASRGVSALLLGAEEEGPGPYDSAQHEPGPGFAKRRSALRPSSAWNDIADYVVRKGWVQLGDRVILVVSPLDGDLNRHYNAEGDFKNNRRLTNCVEIRDITKVMFEQVQQKQQSAC